MTRESHSEEVSVEAKVSMLLGCTPISHKQGDNERICPWDNSQKSQLVIGSLPCEEVKSEQFYFSLKRPQQGFGLHKTT